MRISIVLLLIAPLFVQSCSAQFWKKAEEVIKEQTNQGLSQEEAGEGIKEALVKGVTTGVANVSQLDGYFGNAQIKIPWPKDAEKAETKLRDIGLGNKVDEVILTLNRAAEDAATEAKPIFVSAIKQLTFQDAIEIVKGKDDEATRYLDRTTTAQLQNTFKPIIQNSLDKVDATKHWEGVMNAYNKIPFVEKINPDLAEYVTEKAIFGLFIMIAKEEKLIRDDPAARTSELLKKVFGGNW